MHDVPLAVILTSLGMLAGLAAAWGAFRSRVEHQDRDIKDLRETDKRQAEQIGELTARVRILEDRGARGGAAPADATGAHRPLAR